MSRSRMRPVCGALFLLSASLFSPLSAARSGRAAVHSAFVVGVASWADNLGFFNIRSAPDTAARTMAALHPGDRVHVLGSVHGASVGGVDLWYRIARGGRNAYVLASAVGSLEISGTWTGVTSSNAESGVDAIYATSAPRPDAPSDASFAPGQVMTVLGERHGTAIEGDNSVWYRVSTGSYRPAYIYSAYVKFAHLGAGPVPVPLLSAASVLAVDADTSRVLYSRAPLTPRPPASLVKMMTAAVALDRLQANTVVAVPDGAPSVGAEIGGTAMGLVPGERLSLRDLLYGMLLPSGNDAAYTLAARIAGTQSHFAALMNAKAAALGLRGTHFVQGYGLDAPGQYSTAKDLVRLARYNLAHYPLFRMIVGTAYHYIGVGRTHPAFTLHSTNRLLGVYPGAFGVKTGTTPAAGQNLVCVVNRDGRRILAAILGASDRYADATALLNYAVAVDR